MIDKLVIIGIGLIGGSLARALKSAVACQEVVGCARNRSQLQKALELGVIDRYELDISVAVEGADIVVLAVPVGAVEGVLLKLRGRLGPNTIVTDASSTKGSVVEAARRVFKDVPANFIPGHPIAGTEKSGVEASFAELFQGKRVILTPLPTANRQAIAKVRTMWESAGAEVLEMTVRRHDELLAATSHLPHLLAYTLVDSLARMDSSQEIFHFAAGGFRDFTRIASSDPQMWHDICLANHTAVLDMLERFSEDLGHLAGAIRDRDSARILAIFNHAKAARDHFIAINPHEH